MRNRFLFGSLFALALFHGRPAAAVPDFTPENGVLLSSFTAHSIVPITGGWRLYLTSGSYEIVSASSTDLQNWTLEPGVRLATSASSLDTSSITAVGVIASTDAASGYRMYYVGISSTGLWSVLSATSTNGLVFGKESGSRLQISSGLGFVGQLSPFQASSSLIRLFYIADKDGGNSASNYRIHSASSTNGGLDLKEEGSILSSVQALGVSVSTLTDGRTRIIYTQPLSGSTTAGAVLSAISSNGTSFTAESGTRLSTSAPNDLGPPILVRSTESYRWRLFSTYTRDGSTVPYLSSALTRTPIIDSFSPSQVFKGQIGQSYSITGEIFNTASNPTVSFVKSASTFPVASVSVASDLSITGTFNVTGMDTGFYSIFVANPDGAQGSKSSVLEVKLPPGEVRITDNLFRPLSGGSASIDVRIYEAGMVRASLYTVSGSLVAVLYDGPMTSGNTTLTWSGRTAGGSVVASGVYLLSVVGPGLKTVEKIVVIK